MLVLMAALMMSLAFSGEPASAANRGLKGLWIIKYYTKNGVQIARQCVPFAQTNNISGFRKWSGTWGVVSTNIAGQWVQKGDDLAWYGASGKEAFWAVGDKISKREIAGAYGRFKTTNSATVQVGGWTGNKTDRCTG